MLLFCSQRRSLFPQPAFSLQINFVPLIHLEMQISMRLLLVSNSFLTWIICDNWRAKLYGGWNRFIVFHLIFATSNRVGILTTEIPWSWRSFLSLLLFRIFIFLISVRSGDLGSRTNLCHPLFQSNWIITRYFDMTT